jgi:hypothetical protein
MLNTASVSTLSYENDLSHATIKFWNNTRRALLSRLGTSQMVPIPKRENASTLRWYSKIPHTRNGRDRIRQ